MSIEKVPIIINYNGYRLNVSDKCIRHMSYLMRKNNEEYYSYEYIKELIYCDEIDRNDEYLVQSVIDLGEESYGKKTELCICMIPKMFIDRYKIRENEQNGEPERIKFYTNDILQYKFRNMKNPMNMTPEECQKKLSKLYNLQNTKDDDYVYLDDYLQVVVNEGSGEFSISQKGIDYMNKLAGGDHIDFASLSRYDEYLVKMVKDLGTDADGSEFVDLVVYYVGIGNEEDFSIIKVDGIETVISPDDGCDARFRKITKINPSEYY